jgi:hypothetical protein
VVVPNLKADSYALLTRPPLCPKTSFDLHVLSIPPAFILSQDQTLHFEFVALFESEIISNSEILYKFLDDEDWFNLFFQSIIFSRFSCRQLFFSVRHFPNLAILFSFVNYFGKNFLNFLKITVERLTQSWFGGV